MPPGAATLWLPAPAPDNGGDRAHSPGSSSARFVLPSAVNGALRDFVIATTDPAIKDGTLFQFILLLNDGTGRLLPCVFTADPNNPANVRPFEYSYHSIIAQRGNVTITNNVIRPANGEVAYLHYVMPGNGKVTIIVFNLAGDIINVLARGTLNSGEYSTGWDGKNRGGEVVARGIYFIRVVGPAFDEIRKVLVVK